MCVARLMAKAKDNDPTHFVVGKGRDGTSKNGWNFQVNTAHFQTEEGRASAAIGCSILPNKKATTQTAATQKVVQHIVALCDALSEQDFRGVVSDCAANELKTNKLEGNIVAAPCLMHCAVITAKHGVAPTKTTAHVNCRCGTWDPPDGADEVSWLCCPGCSTWVHALCYGMPDSSTFLCDQCKPNIEEGIDVVWSNANSVQRQLVKGLLDASCGKGQASNFRLFLADIDQEAIYMGREVGDRFFGGFWCSAILLKHQATIADFLAQRIRELEAKKKPPGDEEDERNTPTWWQKHRTWFLSNIGKVYLHTNTVLHSCWGKPCFKDLSAKEASVHEAGPVVLEYRQRLSHWAQNPRAALAFDGTSMDLVRNGPFLPHVLQRLRIIFERMSKRWVHYTRKYEVGDTLHATSTPDADVLCVLPATSCFEESFFGVLSSALKCGGNRAAPWRVSALAVAKHNAH